MSAAAVITGLSTLLTDAVSAEALSTAHETAFRDVLALATEVYPDNESDFTAIANAIPVPEVVDEAAVNQLLIDSRAAHDRYRAASALHNGALALAEIRTAYDLRTQAQTADPAFTASGWALDPVPHADLMAFYAHYIERHGS